MKIHYNQKENIKLLDCDYIEAIDGKWADQKKRILDRYTKLYGNRYNQIKVTRVKSDTKGLRCYIVEGVN